MSPQTLREALESALESLTLADLLRPYYAREINGWFRVTWAPDAKTWEVDGPFHAPGNAYTPPPAEWWVDLGIDSDDNVVAEIDATVRDQIQAEGDALEDGDEYEGMAWCYDRFEAAYQGVEALAVLDVDTIVQHLWSQIAAET